MVESMLPTSLPPKKRERRSSGTVLPRLIDAGIAIVEEGDPAALTIERVCYVAGVSRATFYRRWMTITPVLEGIGTRLLIDANPHSHYTGDLRVNILQAAHGIARLLVRPPVAALFRHFFAIASTNAEIREIVQALDRQRNAPLIRFLTEAQKAGRIGVHCRPEYVAYQVFGPIWHRTLLLQVNPTDDFVETVVDSVLRSIMTPPA